MVLYIFIKIPLRLLATFLFLIFKLIKRNKSWCKWLKSAFKADLFNLNFLIIENRFSKAGYHNSKTIKNGDTK